MSHAYGQVIHHGKIVGHFEYDGSNDVVINPIRTLRSEVTDHWRTYDDADRRCTCGQPPSDVLVYSSYGWGFYWSAKACLPCGVILNAHSPFDDEVEIVDGHPLGKTVHRIKGSGPIPTEEYQ